MVIENLNCWHCGASLEGIPLPLGRREECAVCGSSLHVCRMCDFFEPSVSKDCREPLADDTPDKEAVNLCDYFRPRPGLTGGADPAAANSRARLEALFGSEGAAAAAKAPPAAEGERDAPSEADESRRKLQNLFGKD